MSDSLTDTEDGTVNVEPKELSLAEGCSPNVILGHVGRKLLPFSPDITPIDNDMVTVLGSDDCTYHVHRKVLLQGGEYFVKGLSYKSIEVADPEEKTSFDLSHHPWYCVEFLIRFLYARTIPRLACKQEESVKLMDFWILAHELLMEDLQDLILESINSVCQQWEKDENAYRYVGHTDCLKVWPKLVELNMQESKLGILILDQLMYETLLHKYHDGYEPEMYGEKKDPSLAYALLYSIRKFTIADQSAKEYKEAQQADNCRYHSRCKDRSCKWEPYEEL